VAVVQYTFTHTIHRTTQNKYIEEHKNFGSVRAMPRLCGFCLGTCLTTEEKHGKTSVKVTEECHLAR